MAVDPRTQYLEKGVELSPWALEAPEAPVHGTQEVYTPTVISPTTGRTHGDYQPLAEAVRQPIQNIAETLKLFGLEGTDKWRDTILARPDYYNVATEEFINRNGKGFQTGYYPRALVEQAGQILGSYGARGLGAFIGGSLPLPPPAKVVAAGIGSIVGPFLYEFVQVLGPVVNAQAAGEEPTWEDWAIGAGTAGLSGALNALGIARIPMLNKLLKKARVPAQIATPTERIAARTLSEGTTEGLQSGVEQVGSTITTPGGIDVSLKEMIGEGSLGAGAGLVTATAEAPRAFVGGIERAKVALTPSDPTKIELGEPEGRVPRKERREEVTIPASMEPPTDPLTEVPEKIDKETWSRLSIPVREREMSLSNLQSEIKNVSNYLNSKQYDQDVLKLVKEGALYGDATVAEAYNKIPETPYTMSKEFRDDIKKEAIERTFGVEKRPKRNDYYHYLSSTSANRQDRLLDIAKDVLFNKYEAGLYRPAIKEQLEEWASPTGASHRPHLKPFAEKLLMQMNFNTNSPIMTAVVEQSRTEFPHRWGALVSMADSDTGEIIAEQDSDSRIKTEIDAKLTMIDKANFLKEAQSQNLFQTIANDYLLEGFPENFTSRDKRILEKEFYKELESHPELYREGAGEDLESNRGTLIGDLVANRETAKEAGKAAQGLPKDVHRRYTGQPKLKTFEDYYGKLELPSRLNTSIEELAAAEHGPLDPNFLSYSVMREQLDNLTEAGITTLPAASVLEYILSPYKKLDPKFKDALTTAGIKPSQKQQGQEGPDVDIRKREARDMGIRPYLESLGGQVVEVPYLKRLINDYLGRFKTYEAKEWEGDNIRHETYDTIKGPDEGKFEFVITHVPLLPPEQQALINKLEDEGVDALSDAEKGQIDNIMTKSPDVYTEKESMHNWIENIYGIPGLGTVSWIRGDRRKDSKGRRGYLPGESQSYWIQKTREAMSKAKQRDVSPTKIFRYDFQKQAQEERGEQRADLDELIEFEETLAPEVKEAMAEYLSSVPIKETKGELERHPQGYWRSYLNSPQKGKALDDLLSDINDVYRNEEVLSEYNVGADTLLKQVPNYQKKINTLEQRSELLSREKFIDSFFQAQPLRELGHNLSKDQLTNILHEFDPFEQSYTGEISAYLQKNHGFHLYGMDPEDADINAVRKVIQGLANEATKEASAETRGEGNEIQQEALDKLGEKIPELKEYIEVIAKMPSSQEVQEYIKSLEEGDALIQPDPPFRNTFNQMALRKVIVEALKDGEKYVFIPATVKKVDGKKVYETKTQEKYGQSDAPMFNYQVMLKEAEKIAAKYGLKLEIDTIDVGAGTRGEISVLDIRPLYETVAKEGFKGYRYGGLVTKAQGAGYNINYGDYGRRYK